MLSFHGPSSDSQTISASAQHTQQGPRVGLFPRTADFRHGKGAGDQEQTRDMEVVWSFVLPGLSPNLHLSDLQALKGVCKHIRGAVGSLPQTSWLLAARCGACRTALAVCYFLNQAVKKPWCRNSLPEEHPLCQCSAGGSVPQQAKQLARLHAAVRAGKPAQASVTTRRAGCSTTLLPALSPDGLPRPQLTSWLPVYVAKA